MCNLHGAEAVDDYIDLDHDLADFEEAYCGEWDSEEDFARHIVDECYDLDRQMGSLARYFDYEAFARELFMYDYTMGANGNVFRNL
jgi:antirestriction protein